MSTGRVSTLVLAVLLLALAATACGGRHEFEAALAGQMPAGWTLDRIVVEQDTTSVDAGIPVRQARIRLKASASEPLYTQLALLLGTRVLKPVFEKGDTTEVIAVATGAHVAGAWQVRLMPPGGGLQKSGRPLEQFGTRPYVMTGTAAYQQLVDGAPWRLDQIEKQLLVDEQALVPMHAELKGQEREAASLLAASREQTAADVSRLQAGRDDAQRGRRQAMEQGAAERAAVENGQLAQAQRTVDDAQQAYEAAQVSLGKSRTVLSPERYQAGLREVARDPVALARLEYDARKTVAATLRQRRFDLRSREHDVGMVRARLKDDRQALATLMAATQTR